MQARMQAARRVHNTSTESMKDKHSYTMKAIHCTGFYNIIPVA